MRMIRYNKMIVGGSSILELSEYKSRQGKETSTQELAKEMAKKSKRWTIDGEDTIGWTYSLYELLRALRNEDYNIFIHLRSREYSYDFLRSVTLTDDILDLCDELTDSCGFEFNLRGA